MIDMGTKPRLLRARENTTLSPPLFRSYKNMSLRNTCIYNTVMFSLFWGRRDHISSPSHRHLRIVLLIDTKLFSFLEYYAWVEYGLPKLFPSGGFLIHIITSNNHLISH